MSPPSPPPPPSASPASVWLTLALLLCLLVQVTSSQRPASDLLTSPGFVPPRHHTEDAVMRQTFLREGRNTTPEDSSLLPAAKTSQDSSTSGDTKKGMTGTIHKFLTKGVTRSGTTASMAEGDADPEGSPSMTDLSQDSPTTKESTVTAQNVVRKTTKPGTHGQQHHITTTNNGTSGSVTAWEPLTTRASHRDLDSLALRQPGQRARQDEIDSYEVDHQRASQTSDRGLRMSLQGPLWMDHETLFVELVVLADWSMYRHYRSVPAVESRVRKVVNVANGFLNRVGVVVVLTEVKVWHRGDEITIGSNINQVLNTLMKYRPRLLEEEPNLANDNTVLMTRVDMGGKTAGRAATRGMCRKKQSVSVVEDSGEEPGNVGHILAHEMGHNLGMQHDEVAPGHLGHPHQPCTCTTGKCIMRGGVSSTYNPKLAWSSCSRKFIDKMLKTTALDCLKNVPTKLLEGSSCGDGVVNLSAGEQCDCGPPELCDNRCCDPHTCKLAANATCGTGSCCDTQKCQPKPVGTVCRGTATECDLPEFCSGHSEYCPDDVHKKDGISCGGSKGHCYHGQCGSHEARCQHVWGPYATTASTKCYDKLNTQGDGDGNCGIDPRGNQYLPCTGKMTRCGTLHCVPPTVTQTRFYLEHFNGSKMVDSDTCHYVSASIYYPADDWLTPNGASCAPNRMCVNQKCVKVRPLDGDCAGGCSGRGVCNSRGHCHCDAGYGPPDCSGPGLGGSVDSQAMGGEPDNSHVIIVVWVFVILVVTALIIMCCLWGLLRRCWERGGRDRVSSSLPCCASCIDTCCCPIMTKTTLWMVTVGSSREKNRTVQKDIHRGDAEDGVDEAMICSVDVDIKGAPQTNLWGVADEKLVTDLVTVTPKDSPDLRRKIQLPSNSPILHRKSVDVLDRPKYQQSISVDSGCVSDSDEGLSSKRSSLHMSMTSLISAFKRFGSKGPKTPPENDNRRSRNFGSQKSMPLSRFVVDPLVGSRSSRQGTPPPDNIRPAYSRSVSTDVTRGRLGGAPPPPPPSLKPHKSDENLLSSSKTTKNSFVTLDKPNKHANGIRFQDPPDDGGGLASQPPRRPMMAFRKSLTPPPKTSPPRDKPPLPPLQESKSYLNKDGPIMPPRKKSTTSGHAVAAGHGSHNSQPAANLASNKTSRPRGSETSSTKTNPGDETKKKNVRDLARKFEA